jgi:hypothetical protein
MTRQDARWILAHLRSGYSPSIAEAERMLVRAAGFSTSGCSCPEFPHRRSRRCYAHSYLAPRLDETAFASFADEHGASVEPKNNHAFRHSLIGLTTTVDRVFEPQPECTCSGGEQGDGLCAIPHEDHCALADPAIRQSDN